MGRSLIVSIIVLFGIISGCVYDAPPDAWRVEPDGGVYRTGDPVEVRFSEAIDPQSLKIRIWAGPRDLEGNIAGQTPLLDTCTLSQAPCKATQLELLTDDAGPLARVTIDPEALGAPNTPLILEVQRGLRDAAGNATGISYLFDVQFMPSGSDTPATLTNGTYILVGTLQAPLPGVVITFITDIVSLGNGAFALAGADGDEVEGAPKNTTDPALLEVDHSERGFTLYTTGLLTAAGDGRYLESEPIDLDVDLGAIGLSLKHLVLTAQIVTDESNGHDRLEGTYSYEQVVLKTGQNETVYKAGSTAFLGVFVPPENKPVGTPEVCGDLCGGVSVQCKPPASFPPAGFCTAANESPRTEP
jgi:hypothetical protein